MPNLGLSELLVVFMILLLVFGASRLPALGEGLGRTIRGFKRGLASDDKIAVTEKKDADGSEADEPPASAPAQQAADDVADAEIIDKKG